MLKIEHPVTCFATTAYVYTACTVRVTIVSTSGKFQPVSELRALPLAAHSYALLVVGVLGRQGRKGGMREVMDFWDGDTIRTKKKLKGRRKNSIGEWITSQSS